MSDVTRPCHFGRPQIVRQQLPWYAACILVPAAIGWTPQQIVLLTPVILVIILIIPRRANA